MTATKIAATIGKGLLTANGAIVIRALFRGLDSLDNRLYRAYREIDPFGTEVEQQSSLVEQYSSPNVLENIPEIHLPQLVRNLPAFDLCYKNGCYVDGALPWVDMYPLLAIARDRRPHCLFEIGTFHGSTTRALAISLPDCVVHTIDLPLSFTETKDEVELPKDDFHLIRSRRVGEAFRSDSSIHNVVQHFGDTATWDYSPVRDADFFFIDGSHTYEYVKNDTEKCLALCQERRATILWHDVDHGHPGVVQYLADLVAQGTPVKRIGWTHMAILDL